LWPEAATIAAIALGAIGLLMAWRWRRGFAAGLIGAALLGAGASEWRASLRLADALVPALEGRDIVVEGLVASLPQRGSSGLRFRFDVEAAMLDGHSVRVPEHLALGWYKGWHEDAVLTQPQSELRAGQRWRFTLRLRQPHGNLNPHGFDYELQLFEQGLRATGYVREGSALLLAEGAGHPIERLRQWVRDAIEARIADRRAAGVLAGLAVGDQGAIEREDWDLFRNTGTAHLVSISGLHITMFAWLAGLGVAALWRCSTRLMLCLPVSLAARWGGCIAAFAYALFSGWGVPSQRTVWMLATVTLLQASGRHWPWSLVLLAAAVVVTALDPWALLQAGFWLSFAAVGLLMISAPAHTLYAAPHAAVPSAWPRRLWATLRDGLRTQAVATLGLAPLTLVFFQQLSLVGFAANLVAIPLITLVITPLALLGVIWAPLWSLGAWVVAQLSIGLAGLAALPGAVWVVPVAPLWAQLAGLLGAALVLLPLPWRLRALALPLALPLLLPTRELPASGAFELVALDVGQGTAVLVRTRGHLLVYDAGPQYSRDSDAGQRVLLPLLRARGDTHVDTLLLSHRDIDHVGGARAVLSALPVGELLSSLEPGHPLLALSRATRRCETGQSWVWDGVRFELLRPPPADYERSMKSNAMSCVLRVAGDHASALLTGDIELDQEAALVGSLGAALQSDVLIVPHHGSKTSSSAAFLDAVRPGVAVFQAGYRNRFGHPAPEVLARYRERGIAVMASATCGAWTESSTATSTCEREKQHRYWHHRGVE
jgi:competence protein ComEC